jgi:peptide/nickel transport system substrate-binding protein
LARFDSLLEEVTMARSTETGNALLDARLNRRTLAKGFAGVAVATPAVLREATRTVAQEASPVPVTGGELHLTMFDSPNTNLAGILGITGPATNFLGSTVYNGLVTSSANWEEVEPGLAESWEISEDGLTYTFHLRQGVTWHDGESFTAEDVEFTYLTLLNPAVASIYASVLKGISGAQEYIDGTTPAIAGITIIDDHTVSFTLDAPNAVFLSVSLTGHVIIPKHVWGSVSAADIVKPELWEKTQIGTGPFKFVEYVPDRYLTIERYDEGWRGAPLLDRILFVFVGTTPAARDAALEAGQVDFVQVSADDYERLKADSNLILTLKPVYNVRYFSINVAKPHFADKRVRQALAYAIDRVGICESILAPIATPTNALMPSKKWANPNLPTYDFDPEKAKSLLAEAGWDSGTEIELSSAYTDQPHVSAVAYVQQQLADVGVKSSIVTLDTSAFSSYYYDEKKFDITLAGFSFAPDFDEFARQFSSDAVWPAGQNAGLYANPRVDELFQLGRSTNDEAQRQAYYFELQSILADELPWIPFYALNIIAGVNARVHNADGVAFPWNRPHNWHSEEVWVSE